MNAQEREDLRHAVLEAVVTRRPAAIPLRGIRRHVAREVDFQFTDQELEAEVEYLHGKGAVSFEFDPVGSTKWWTVTAAGVDLAERGRS